MVAYGYLGVNRLRPFQVFPGKGFSDSDFAVDLEE
jgi:hypothetical protein